MPVTISSSTKRPEIKTDLPGPNGRKIVEGDAKFVNPAYLRPSFKLVAERASGVWVEDVDGNLFLDCNAGAAVCSTGHCHPEVVKAIQQQAEKLIHICGTDYYYRHMPQLAEKLDAIVPIKSPTRTHFANSGTEAVETALKLAMHATGREKFIGFLNSFHGRTLGSLSLTSSKAAQRKGFKRQALDVVHVPYPNEFRNPFSATDCGDGGASQGALNWIEERLFKTTTPPEEVAAIVVEAVQGEGGYVPAPKDFLKGLRRICDQHGILLIVDEVQSGMGRTGKMFACEHYEVQPDIICIAKGIGSGLPLGACVARADLMDWKPGAHASTFGGNPVCIAAALKTIELLEEGLVKNAAVVGAFLKAGLEKLQRKYDCIGDVRGMGLMIGVEFVTDKVSLAPDAELRDRIEMACFERGLIILGAGTSTIRWSPPLILTSENAAVALEIFDEAISASITDSRILNTVDRKKVEDKAPKHEYVMPRTEIEEVLAGIWARVLGVERVGIHDDFFELGGDSLLSIQIISRANQAGLRLSTKDLFLHQTVAKLAAVAGAAAVAAEFVRKETEVSGRKDQTLQQIEEGLVVEGQITTLTEREVTLRVTVPKFGEIAESYGEIKKERGRIDPNSEAYQRDKAQLESTFAGHIVAYADGKRIAVGRNVEELTGNIPPEYQQRPLFIKDIPERPPMRFRRPFFVRNKE